MSSIYYSRSGRYNPAFNRVYDVPSCSQRVQFPPIVQNPAPPPLSPATRPSPVVIPPPSSGFQQPTARLPRITPVNHVSDPVLPQLFRLLANDYIEVNLQARGWVLGIILATVQLFDAVAGWGYKVRFKPRDETCEQEGVFPHDPEYIRLPQPEFTGAL